MTIRFAAARRRENAVVARACGALLPLVAANDNGAGLGSDRLMSEALRHFARHGLCAAERAREIAEAAFFAGDRNSYRHWLAICRLLDRRMADAVTAHRGSTGTD